MYEYMALRGGGYVNILKILSIVSKVSSKNRKKENVKKRRKEV